MRLTGERKPFLEMSDEPVLPLELRKRVSVKLEINSNVLSTADICWQTEGERGPLVQVTEQSEFDLTITRGTIPKTVFKIARFFGPQFLLAVASRFKSPVVGIEHRDYPGIGRICVLSNQIESPLFPESETFERDLALRAWKLNSSGEPISLKFRLEWIADQAAYQLTASGLSRKSSVYRPLSTASCDFDEVSDDIRDNRGFTKSKSGRLHFPFPPINQLQASKDTGGGSCIWPDWRYVEPSERNRGKSCFS